MAIYTLDDLRRAVPQNMRGMSDEELVRDYSSKIGRSYEDTANYLGLKPRGTLAEMGRQIVGGAVVDLPRMVGQSLQYTGLAPEYGREMAQAAEARAPAYEPDMRGRGLVGQAGVLGARALAPVGATLPLAFVPGGQFAAPAAAATLFGTSAAQETYEKLIKQGISEEDASAAARRVGLVQGPLEGAATAVGLRAVRPLATALGGARTTGQVAGALTDTSVLRPFAKGMGINLAVQPTTEVIQDVGTELIERSYGAQPEDIGQIAGQSALGGVGLTMLLGPLAAGSSISRSRRAATLKDALYGENTDPAVRAKAMDIVMAEARRQGIPEQNVDQWFDSQLQLEDERTAALRAAEQAREAQRRVEQVDLLGGEAQGLEGLQATPFSSLDQQRQFEEGVAGLNIPTAFSSVDQQREFETGLTQMREAQVARAGEQYQDLLADRASTLMAAQDVGQQFQDVMAPQTRGLEAATRVGEEWQEMEAGRRKRLLELDEIGQEWQQMSGETLRPVTGELTEGQKRALREPSGKRLRKTISELPEPEVTPLTTLLPQPPVSSELPAQPAAPSSLLSDRPAPVSVAVEGVSPTPGGLPTVTPAAPQGAAGALSTTAEVDSKQERRGPVSAGSVVKVNDTDVTLNQEQADAWNAAQESYDGKVRRAKAISNYQERDSALRAAGMQLSAERRKITGALTAKERQAAGAASTTAKGTAKEEEAPTPLANVSDAIKEDNEIDRVLKSVADEADTQADKLFAGVTGGMKKAPGKPSMPAQVYAAIRNAILNPKGAVMVRKAKSVDKDVALTEKYGDKVKQIAAAARKFAEAYEAYASTNLVRSNIVIKRGETADQKIAGVDEELRTKARQVQAALANLGQAVEGNAKDVEAIVRFVKDRAQKEKRGDIKIQNADILLSRAWTAAKNETFMGEPDLLATSPAAVRQSQESTEKGATPQLFDAVTEGYATFGRGPKQPGLNGLLNYIRTQGTTFEKLLAQAIKKAIEGKREVKVEFIKEGKSRYEPKTNTIFINQTSSKEVALHEALHGALQWFVYTNPNLPQVAALKASLKRVVEYDTTKLPPKAAEVQAALKKVMSGKSKTAELDAVLELISYGNTLNDFRRALQGMESNTPRLFVKFANDVMEAIYALVRRMLGVKQSVASDVIENTFQLLESARAAQQDTAAKGKGNTLEAAVATASSAFKNWFRGSKVANKDGEAKIVYTGTSKDVNFATFKVPKNGVWFTEDAESASSYAVENDSMGFKWEGGKPVTVNTASRVMPVFLRIQNPYTMTSADMAKINKQNYKKAQGEFFDTLRSQGYDGVNMGDGIWVVLKEPAQIKSAIGNRGAFDPESGNILEAAVETDKPLSDAKIAEALDVREQDFSRWNKSNAVQLQVTQRFFEMFGWNEANAKKFLGAAGDKTRAFISKNFPGAEIALGWINARYNVNETVSKVMDRYKLDKGIGYQYAEDIANVIERRPAEEVNAVIAYLDGDTNALDAMPDSLKLKAVADKLKQWFKTYVAELSPVEQQWFNNRKFSETLLFPSSTEQVAGSTFGLGKINEVLGVKTESEVELDQDWFRKNDDGDLILDGDMYRVFQPDLIKNNGEMIPAGFMSASRFAELGQINPMGFTVDTSRRWVYGGVVQGKHTFTTNTTAKEKIANEKADDVANALRNTIGALANNYASKNFIKSVYDMGREGSAHAQVAFDSLDAVNAYMNKGVPADQRVVIREDMVLPVSKEISRSPQTKSLYRQSGTWVKLPERSPVYGELAGKYIPGPVWNAMIDMSDRQPLVNLRAVNNTMRWFKKSKTTWNFGTHVTNTASNITMAMTHDISFGTMRDAARILAKYEANPKSLTKQELDLMMAFRDSGAMLADYSSAEVKVALYKAHEANLRGGEDVSVARRVAGWLNVEKSKAEWLQTQAKRVGNKAERLDDITSQLYAAEDNIFRMAAFLKTAGALQQRAGLKAPTTEMLSEAGLFARKAFGDYDIDSKAVKIARQSVLPFISWFYAMAPVIGRIAVYEPWKIVNVLGAYMILEAAMSAVAGDDDEEVRKQGPQTLRERMFGSVGPYLHVRVPFMGDDENPVYYKLGDYFPLASFTRGLPNGLMGQSWIPASLTPSGPFVSAILGLVGGVDPYTGKAIHKPTDTEWQKLWTSTKFAYDTMTIPMLTTRNIEKVNDIVEGKTGITGAEPSSLAIARAFGFKFYDYNVAEQEAINDNAVKRIKRDFSTAITQAKRDEYRKAYPDYDALDEKLDDLRTRMEEAINKARGGEEE